MFTRSALLSVVAAARLALAATVCNSHAELCEKSYGAVTFLGAHNSYAVGTNLADNQHKDVTDQLNDGIRTLQVQAHNATDGVHLCHSSCSLQDAGLLEDWLKPVATWVDANPTEVITFIVVNSDNLPVTTFSAAFEAAGLGSKAYGPSAASLAINEWPTLGSLIDANTPVMIFMDNQADHDAVPWIIDEFTNIWEDAYDVTTTTWECAVNRSQANSGSSMMLVNHFLDNTYNLGGTTFFIPNKDQLNVTNSEASLSLHVGNCNSVWGRNPNHILLDFYDSNGNEPFNYVATLNSVSAPTNTVEALPVASNTGTSQTAQVSTSSLDGGATSRVDLSTRSVMLGLGLAVLGAAMGGMKVFA